MNKKKSNILGFFSYFLLAFGVIAIYAVLPRSSITEETAVETFEYAEFIMPELTVQALILTNTPTPSPTMTPTVTPIPTNTPKPTTTPIPNETKYYSASRFNRAGVVFANGWRWTWYSDTVLPGGGLRIPGRHYDEYNYICDEDGYLCLASNVLDKGTVIDTPFGKKGKIYDCGCPEDTVDVYVHWNPCNIYP